MKVIVEGVLDNLFKKPDYTDKVSGETKEGKYIAQVKIEEELKNKEIRKETFDISLPNEKASQYKDLVGETIQITCQYFSKEKITFYGV